MPRVNKVKSARKAQGNCRSCGAPINIGDGYLWFQFRHSSKNVRCLKPECYPKASERTQSEILSAAYTIGETYNTSDIGTWEDLESVRDDVQSAIDEIIEMIQEKQDNIESGCGHTSLPVWEELDERRAEYESWRDEVESVDIDQEEKPEEDDYTEDGVLDSDAYDRAVEEWEQSLETAKEELQAAIDACPE